MQYLNIPLSRELTVVGVRTGQIKRIMLKGLWLCGWNISENDIESERISPIHEFTSLVHSTTLKYLITPE